jgi:hypothetical protein
VIDGDQTAFGSVRAVPVSFLTSTMEVGTGGMDDAGESDTADERIDVTGCGCSYPSVSLRRDAAVGSSRAKDVQMTMIDQAGKDITDDRDGPMRAPLAEPHLEITVGNRASA